MTPRIAIVTGAARGLGAATARRLASDGFAVAIVDLSAEHCTAITDEINAAGGTALAFGADVTSEEAVASCVAAIASDLGPPTVLVNNAGITRDNLIFKMSLSDWDSVISVHLRGAFLMTRAVQEHMVAANWGRIVNLSSISALGNRGQANYSAAKAGLQGFTKALAFEMGRFGVTANAVAPGFIKTEMTVATAERLGQSWEDFAKSASRRIAVQRIGTPEEVAGTISFLCSDDAGYISGQVIYVAGGPTN